VSVEVGEANEGLELHLCFRNEPLLNSGNLDWIHLYSVLRNDEAKVLDPGLFKLTFLQSEEELMLLEDLHNPVDYFPVLLKGVCKDEDVV
jgi:hypothetical protein